MNGGVESFIIRIYRRDREKPENVAGLVEIVGSEEKRPFRNCGELWSILSTDHDTARGRKRAEASAK